MKQKTPFRKEDIGAEILPILTSGLYRHALDTLREYIQNSIDARARNIAIAIDPDVVSISDDGAGMTWDQARQAIRLGISEKNPLHDIGFRGIGIYSAFNLCDRLEIYTRPSRQRTGFVLRFDFRKMRDELLKESERGKQGLPPGLYLEKLLRSTVSVSEDDSAAQSTRGTIAILSEVRPEVYDILMNWQLVTEYLQNTVPLPFRPGFKRRRTIERRFREEDYRTVNGLSLQVGAQKELLYRPYHNEMFSHGGEYPPKFIDVSSNGQKFGFAWIYINDARRVLPDAALRGILIKKFGFSIANRSFLEPFFGRTVFSRRLTGELIVQHKDLIPNAARSDFEPNTTRQTFFQDALPKFISTTSAWANDIQQREKADEVMADAVARLSQISSKLPRVQRDREELLKLNVELARIEDRLKPHLSVLVENEPAQIKRTRTLLSRCQRTIRVALVEGRRSGRKLERRVVESLRKETSRRAKNALASVPKDLVELLDSYDLLADSELRRVIGILDGDVLQIYLDRSTYRAALSDLQDALDES